MLQAIRKAKTRIDIMVFRLDRDDAIKALSEAVGRGVPVRALIAHTARGDEKRLRKLELRLLEAGAGVSRTADDLPRYHGKMILADDTLHVLAFNYTKADLKSRSFGIATDDQKLVAEAVKLFEADFTKQPYDAGHKQFVVSPENARETLAAFLEGARRELLIYDHKVSDRRMIKLLLARMKAGVDVRIVGKISAPGGDVPCDRIKLRQHVRAIVRDGSAAFVGSQSLRALELDGRREVGLIVNDPAVVKQMRETFEADWATTAGGRKQKKKDEERVELSNGRSA